MKKFIHGRWIDPYEEYQKHVIRNEKGEPVGITGPVGPLGPLASSIVDATISAQEDSVE